MPLLAAWLLSTAPSERIRMGVFFAGQPAGESTYVRNEDGMFSSRLQATIGTSEISGVVEGKFEASRIVRYSSRSCFGSSAVDLTYSSGKLQTKTGGVARRLPSMLGEPCAASLYPQITADLLSHLGKTMKPGESKRTRVVLVDSGTEGACTIRFEGTRAIPMGTVRRFEVDYGTTEAEYLLDRQGDAVAMDVPGQRLRFLVPGWEALFDDAAVKKQKSSAPTMRTETRRNLRMRTRDGTELVADIMKPVGKGPFPAILERTPYGRAPALKLAEFWARCGYVVVVQDCRGRGDGGGNWDPFIGEGKDGYDAVEWVARQSWCDGKVGMVGDGYAAVDAWQAAVERPPSLRCLVPLFSYADAMRNFPYEYGTFDLQRALAWTHFAETRRPDHGKISPKALAGLPLSRLDKAVFGRTNPIYQRWLQRTTMADWSGYDPIDRLSQVEIPSLNFSGWLDENGIGTTLNWEALRRAGRKDQWLVEGPWEGTSNLNVRSNVDDLGPDARFDSSTLTLRFFDTYLKGKSVGMEEEPRVRAFVTGANRWVALDGWPSSASPLETLFLAPNVLQKTPGSTSQASIYVYDPSKDHGANVPSSPKKASLPDPGTYALFKGEPFEHPTAIAGPFEVRLFFKSSAVDTDLFATLLDVAPDGSLKMIGQPGKLRASYRESLRSPSLLTPGQNYSALLRPWDEAHELAAGHRLGLLVDSSLFPRFARNLGTGEPFATAKRSVPQRNVILTGTVTPSRITYRRLW